MQMHLHVILLILGLYDYCTAVALKYLAPIQMWQFLSVINKKMIQVEFWLNKRSTVKEQQTSSPLVAYNPPTVNWCPTVSVTIQLHFFLHTEVSTILHIKDT